MKQASSFCSCSDCVSRVNSIFKTLHADEVDHMDDVKSCMLFKKGQILFSEGSNPIGIYCINHGKVKLTTSGLNGKEQILRLLKNGDIVGYTAIISNERYHCSSVAMEDTSVCFIPKDVFLKILMQNQNTSFETLKLLSQSLRQSEDQLVAMAQKNVRERMAEALLFFQASYGVNENDSSLNISFSREEIADFVGTSTETAIRLLSEFNHDGYIQLSGKKIKILNPDKLIRLANIDA